VLTTALTWIAGISVGAQLTHIRDVL
jgi:hypothetical protein